MKNVLLFLACIVTGALMAQPIQPPKMPVFPTSTWSSFEDFLEKESRITIVETTPLYFKIEFYINSKGEVLFPIVEYSTNEDIAQQLFATLLKSPTWKMDGVSPKMITKVIKNITISSSKWVATYHMMNFKEETIDVNELKASSGIKRIEHIKEAIKANDEQIYSFAGLDVKPEFPGGIEAFYKFIVKNYHTPEKSGLKGQVIVSFVIEKDGSLTDIKVLRDVGYGSGEEAVRMLKLSPLWSPAQQNGNPVRCQFMIPIKIEVK